jgi:hypothetical protein
MEEAPFSIKDIVCISVKKEMLAFKVRCGGWCQFVSDVNVY